MQPPTMNTFAEFWPFYLGEHARPLTRGLHYVGTAGVIATVGAAVFTGRWSLLAVAPIFGYGFAWAGHFFVEHNRPATFRHPLWSMAADFVMFGKMLRGRIGAELARHARAPASR